MTSEKKELIVSYLQNQLAQHNYRVKNYVLSTTGEPYPQRNAFLAIDKIVKEFQKGNASYRWLTVCGLRGVGKTTLALQIFSQIEVEPLQKLYISVDEVTRQLGVSLSEVLEGYEEILGVVFERLNQPVYIFLDEVQYDTQWALTLKSIYDRSRKVFICATGSSSLMLQTNADVSRRSLFQKVYPMSFTEYLKLKEGKFEKKGLSQQIRHILFHSNSAQEVFEGLHSVRTATRQYWARVDRLELEKYVKTGTLPFMLRLGNDGVAYDQMKKTVDSIITKDIPQVQAFDTTILACVPRLLYLLANSDTTSVTSLTNDLGISTNTVNNILDVLEKTELLVRIYPNGSRSKQIRKPSKYLFASPAFRSMYLNFIGSTFTEEQMRGKFYEDLVGMYLTRYLSNKGITYSLTYDSSKGGADFILGLKESDLYIAIEVSSGKKDFKQLLSTSRKIGNKFKYGMNISMSELSLDSTGNFVNVPISYFLLT